jgi:hypothetical protein
MDNEETIRKAFNTFDLSDSGVLNVEELRLSLTSLGDKLGDKEAHEHPSLRTCWLLTPAPAAQGDVCRRSRSLGQLRLRQVRADNGREEQRQLTSRMYDRCNKESAEKKNF